LRKLGAELVEAKGQEKDKGKNKSYHLKAIAVVQCPWREVLYLVSRVAVSDGEILMNSPLTLRCAN
jgi:alpha 1,2-mannosyltransferase